MAPPKVKPNDLFVGQRYAITMRDGDEQEMIKGNFYSRYKFGHLTFRNVLYNGKKVDTIDIPEDIIISITPEDTSAINKRYGLGGKSKSRRKLRKTRKY